MTGRGVDQILAHPSSPKLFEPSIDDAREYIALAEDQSGPIKRPVGPSYVWGDALEILAQPSIQARIVNLETSVTRDGQPWPDKGIHYRMHPANVGSLTAGRIDVCTLANNHSLDWGRDAFTETLDVLREAGLRTAGAGRTAGEALRPACIGGGEARVIAFAFADESSGVPREWEASEAQPGVAFLPRSKRELDALGDRIAEERSAGGVVVASVHWGSNWGYEVEPWQMDLAHALVDRGVDVVQGHSSHHPRPIEIYRQRLVLYGCGDFLNDYEGIRGYEHFRSDRVIAYLPELDAATGALVALRMTPMRTRRMRLEHVPEEDALWMADRLTEISRPYGTVGVSKGGRSLVVTT
jgi:poly-gamma-glutamate synthesis protein (capsule biosynthesis protein)